MKGTKISLVIHGAINIVLPLPMLFVTSFWGLLIIAAFNLDSITEPFWYMVTMFPILIPPASCMVGIIRGIKNIKKDTYARLCLILSIIGLFLYVGMMILCGWLGSRL